MHEYPFQEGIFHYIQSKPPLALMFVGDSKSSRERWAIGPGQRVSQSQRLSVYYFMTFCLCVNTESLPLPLSVVGNTRWKILKSVTSTSDQLSRCTYRIPGQTSERIRASPLFWTLLSTSAKLSTSSARSLYGLFQTE